MQSESGDAPAKQGGGPRAWVVALTAVLVTLTVVGGALGGYVIGRGSGPELAKARAEGARAGAAKARARLTPAKRKAARRQGLKSGYRVAYRRALRTTKKKVAAGGPRNCGDAATNDTPSISKVRAEGVGCATALEFARSTKSCQDPTRGCGGYQCSTVTTGYEEGEFTCRRGSTTIRFLSGV